MEDTLHRELNYSDVCYPTIWRNLNKASDFCKINKYNKAEHECLELDFKTALMIVVNETENAYRVYHGKMEYFDWIY